MPHNHEQVIEEFDEKFSHVAPNGWEHGQFEAYLHSIKAFFLKQLTLATQAERSRIEEIIVGYFGEEGKSQATVLLRMLPTNTERTESVLEMLDQQIGRAARALGEV